MLARQLQHARGASRVLAPVLLDVLQRTQSREIRLFEIFSEEKRAARKQKLKDDMQRGYFDDFKDFRDNNGKLFYAPDRLIPPGVSQLFPTISALSTDGTAPFPPSGPAAPAVSLVGIAFRDGAQGMIEAWAIPFSQAFSGTPGAALVELSLVESVVMRLWPFRAILVSGGGKSQSKYTMPCRYLYDFKDSESTRAALRMTNRLTGYVYLVDAAGKVRWQGCGFPTSQEIETMLACSQQLLNS